MSFWWSLVDKVSAAAKAPIAAIAGNASRPDKSSSLLKPDYSEEPCIPESEDTREKLELIRRIDDFGALRIATRTRRALHQTPNPNDANDIECEAVESFSGSYNIAYKLEFDDGLVWIIRVPFHGTAYDWTEADAAAMKTEVMIMQLLKKDTTIPVPEVYGFDTSLNNEACVPYILMEYINVAHLGAYWNNAQLCDVEQHLIRGKAMKDLAGALVQLGKYRFHATEEIAFDLNGNIQGLSSSENGSTHCVSTCESQDKSIVSSAKCLIEAEGLSSRETFFPGLGNKWLLLMYPNLHGITGLLRLWIQSLPSNHLDQTPAYTLHHPDIDTQNVLVGQDGGLRAIIDWDGTSIVPVCFGQAYPMWLRRDWHPERYNYEEATNTATWDEIWSEDIPDEFASLRSQWLQHLRDAQLAVSTKDVLHQEETTQTKNRETPIAWNTRKSLIYSSLRSAAQDENFETRYPEMIFDKVVRVDGVKDELQINSETKKNTSSSRTADTCHNEVKNDANIEENSGEDRKSLHGPAKVQNFSTKPRTNRAPVVKNHKTISSQCLAFIAGRWPLQALREMALGIVNRYKSRGSLFIASIAQLVGVLILLIIFFYQQALCTVAWIRSNDSGVSHNAEEISASPDTAMRRLAGGPPFSIALQLSAILRTILCRTKSFLKALPLRSAQWTVCAGSTQESSADPLPISRTSGAFLQSVRSSQRLQHPGHSINTREKVVRSEHHFPSQGEQGPMRSSLKKLVAMYKATQRSCATMIKTDYISRHVERWRHAALTFTDSILHVRKHSRQGELHLTKSEDMHRSMISKGRSSMIRRSRRGHAESNNASHSLGLKAKLKMAQEGQTFGKVLPQDSCIDLSEGNSISTKSKLSRSSAKPLNRSSHTSLRDPEDCKIVSNNSRKFSSMTTTSYACSEKAVSDDLPAIGDEARVANGLKVCKREKTQAENPEDRECEEYKRGEWEWQPGVVRFRSLQHLRRLANHLM